MRNKYWRVFRSKATCPTRRAKYPVQFGTPLGRVTFPSECLGLLMPLFTVVREVSMVSDTVGGVLPSHSVRLPTSTLWHTRVLQYSVWCFEARRADSKPKLAPCESRFGSTDTQSASAPWTRRGPCGGSGPARLPAPFRRAHTPSRGSVSV